MAINAKDILTRRVREPTLPAAMFVLGMVDSFNITTIVERLIEYGYDSPALYMIAGEVNPLASEWVPLFKKAMTDLNVEIPTEYQAARRIAKELARMIVDGEITPGDGATAIWNNLFLVKGFTAEITYFDELTWALEAIQDGRPYLELSREDIEKKIIAEAKRLAEGP